MRVIKKSLLVVLTFALISLNLPSAFAAESVSNIRISKSNAVPGELLTITADISSPSGVSYVNMILDTPSGGTKGFSTYFQLISGSEQQGTWSMNFNIPSTAENGTWKVIVGLGTKDQTSKIGYGPSINVSGSTVVETKVSNVKLSKTNARAGEELTIFADISSPSGVSYVNMILTPPSGGSKGFSTYFQLISGTEQQGTWSMKFNMPQSAENGDWGVVVGMGTKDQTSKIGYGPSIKVSTAESEAAEKAAAEKAASEKAAAEKAASEKAAAEKAAAEKVAAEKVAADKAAAEKASADKVIANDFNVLVSSINKYKIDISNLFNKYPGYFQENPDMKSSLQRALDFVIPTTPSKADNEVMNDLISGGVGKKALVSELLLAQLGIATFQAIEKMNSKSAKKITTINCIKGKTVKKVSAVNPKCPAGYKKK